MSFFYCHKGGTLGVTLLSSDKAGFSLLILLLPLIHHKQIEVFVFPLNRNPVLLLTHHKKLDCFPLQSGCGSEAPPIGVLFFLLELPLIPATGTRRNPKKLAPFAAQKQIWLEFLQAQARFFFSFPHLV